MKYFALKLFLTIFVIASNGLTLLAQSSFLKQLSVYSHAKIDITHDNGYVIAFQNNNAIALIKLNEVGDIQYQNSLQISSITLPEVTSIIQTNDSGFAITARNYKNSLLIKTNLNFDTLWTRNIGKPNYTINLGNVEETYSGDLVAFGAAYDSTVGASGVSIIIKFNSYGDTLFTKSINNISVWGTQYNPVSGIITMDRGFLLNFKLWNAVIKTDSLGNYKWDYQNILLGAVPKSFSENSSGDIYISYSILNSFIVEKIDSGGNLLWSRPMKINQSSTITKIRSNYDDGYILMGSSGTIEFILIADSSGAINDSFRINGLTNCCQNGIDDLAMTPDSGFISLFHTSPGNELLIKKYNNSYINCMDTLAIYQVDTFVATNPQHVYNSNNFNIQYNNSSFSLNPTAFSLTTICSNLSGSEEILNEPAFKIFPNPLSMHYSDLNITLPFIGNWVFKAIDMKGEIIAFRILNNKQVDQSIPFIVTMPGIYFINISNGNFNLSQRLIILD